MEGPKTTQNECINHDNFEQYKLQIIEHYMLEIENFDNAARFCTYNESPTFSYNPPIQLQPSHRYAITPCYKSSSTSSSPSRRRNSYDNWSFDENDMKRKTRINTYRAYTMETKFKACLKKWFSMG